MTHSDVIIGHVVTSSVKLHQEVPCFYQYCLVSLPPIAGASWYNLTDDVTCPMMTSLCVIELIMLGLV